MFAHKNEFTPTTFLKKKKMSDTDDPSDSDFDSETEKEEFLQDRPENAVFRNRTLSENDILTFCDNPLQQTQNRALENSVWGSHQGKIMAVAGGVWAVASLTSPVLGRFCSNMAMVGSVVGTGVNWKASNRRLNRTTRSLEDRQRMEANRNYGIRRREAIKSFRDKKRLKDERRQQESRRDRFATARNDDPGLSLSSSAGSAGLVRGRPNPNRPNHPNQHSFL
jgi:hypothetical protein